MKQIRSLIVLLVVMLMPLAANASHQKEGQIDIPEMVLEHLSDSYEWHIASYEGKSLSIPLPIIVRSSATGDWTLCTAENLPANYFFDAEHHGKIYEKMPDGTSVRPLDLSITKTVAQIWIVVFVLIAVFLYCARWYKNRDEKSEAPRGFVGLMEMFVMTIYDDVIKAAIGEKRFKPFAPYLLTVFFFIFTTNLLGLLPIFPGGANVTGNINITFFLAMCTMIAINLFGNKEYWKDIFWPHVPVFLKAPVPLMPVIEFFGVFTKPFALMVRLFANMMAGHAIAVSLICIIFIVAAKAMAVMIGMSVLGIVMAVFMMLLECMVCFIQAMVFTMLSSIFIGLAREK